MGRRESEPAGGVELERSLVHLIREADAAGKRFDSADEAGALDEAIGLWEQVLAHRGLEDASADIRSDAYVEAGNVRFQRFWSRGDANDLELALGHYHNALVLEPSGDGLARALTNLGNALQARFELSGDVADLERAVEAFQGGVDASPDGPARAGRLTNLGTGLTDLGKETGDERRFRAGLDALEEAVRTTPPDSPHLGTFLNNLGLGLLDRYDRAGDIDDLDRAVEAFDRSVEVTPPGSPYLLSRLQNIGMALLRRDEIAGGIEDLNRAIEMIDGAVAAATPGAPEILNGLNNLGAALQTRYERTGDFDDLLAATKALERALEETPDDSPLAAARHANLANALQAVYISTRLADVLDRSIELEMGALERVSPESRDRVGYLNGLGTGLQYRFELAGNPNDLQAAIAAFREGSRLGRDEEPRSGFITARNWAQWAAGREAWSEAAEAYGYALRALDRVFRAQLLRRHKELRLVDAQGLPARAAFAYARAGDPGAAAVALEEGQALLLSEALERDRSDLHRLEALGHGGLRRRYEEAAARWNQLERAELEGPRARHSAEDVAERLRQARADLDATVHQIREVPGYEKFLQPADMSDVLEGAGSAPLVYLAPAETGGLGLVVRGETETVAQVDLGDLTAQAVRERVETLRSAYSARRQREDAWLSALDDVTSWLWEAAMGPTLEAIGSASRAHVIAAGVLSLLPLHAAWTPDAGAATGRRYALDGPLLTFTPNARSLTAARAAFEGSPTSILAVDDPRPQSAGVEQLPNSELEVEAAVATFASATVLAGEQALAADVLSALRSADVVHLSCHGRAELQDPLQSFLLMSGGVRLTLGALLGQRLAVKLAILSACETGVPGDVLPDEAVGLPTGFAQAGAGGVVASLWSVPEAATMMLMTRFYQLWRGGGRDPADALREAQRWVRDATNGEKARDLEQYLPRGGGRLATRAAEALWRDLVLRDPGERDDAHPYNWAAFSYVGASSSAS